MFTQLAVVLNERVELASPEWIVAMQRFLEGAAELRAALKSPFSFSARYSDPPPHLDASGGSCGYRVRVSAGAVEVNAQPSADADYVTATGYNAALPIVCTVHGGDSARFERMRREYERLSRVTSETHGQLPNDPALVRLLTALHDHMAVRTVNNPDIDHRIAQQGLTANIADLHERGYTVLENAFSPEYADEMRAETHRNHDSAPDSGGFRATMLLRRGRIWEEAAQHPWVLTLADHLLGRGCLMYQSDTIVKGPGQETHPGLHSDYSASRVQEPFPEYCLEATAVWAIDDFSAPSGPTVVLPGSHKMGRQVPPGTTQSGAVMIEMGKGSIAFWNGALWHGSAPRSAPGKRTSLHNAYVRNFMRPIECYEDIDAAIIQRNAPQFSTLCGLDDAFGKSGDSGADFERLSYAARAGYGSSAPLVRRA